MRGDAGKGSTTQQAVMTVQAAFDFLLPLADRPSVGHILGWLRLADVGRIVDLIARVSKASSVRSPRHVIFSELQKISGARQS